MNHPDRFAIDRIRPGYRNTAALRKLLCILSLASFVISAGHASNWPQFRGPTGQGHSDEKNLPIHWNAQSNVAWTASIPGQAWSSPIIWNDHVFLTTATDSGTRCHIMALRRSDGRILWNTEVFQQVPLRKENKNSYATPTPVTDGEMVVAVFGDGSIAAVDFDGNLVWTNRETKFYSRHGLGASPIIHRGLVIMAFDGSNRVMEAGAWPNNSNEERLGWQIPWEKAELVALDRKTGKRVWTGKRGKSRIAHATPIIYREAGEECLLSIAGDVIQSFNPATGERLWSAFAQGEGLVPSPVVGNGLIFAASGYEKTTLRAIRPGGRGDVSTTHIVWEQKKGVPTQPSLLYVEPRLYGLSDGGIVSCYEPASGEVLWQERIGGNYSASPVFGDGRIYIVSEAGETTVLRADGQFEIIARNSLNTKCQASPAISQGQIFLRTESSLFCVGRR